MADEKDLFVVQVFWGTQRLRFNFESSENALAAYMALRARGLAVPLNGHGDGTADENGNADVEVIDDAGNRGSFSAAMLDTAVILMTDIEADLEADLDVRLAQAVNNGKFRMRVQADKIARSALPPQISQMLTG